MKYLRMALLAVTAAFIFPGCDMTEDDRNCPRTENVTLNFSLLDKKGAEVFKENIEKNDLLLFDGSGRYHSYLPVATSSLNGGQSISLTLDPGTYTVVSWANVGSNSGITSPQQLNTCDDGQVWINSTDSGDPVYYGADPALGLTRNFNPDQTFITFTVPERGSVNETIRFTHAHNKLDVYVSGYSTDGKLPIIEIEGSKRGFDFYMNSLNDGTCSFTQPTADKATSDGTMANAAFNIPRIKKDNNIEVSVLHPETGEKVWTIALKDVLESFDDFDLEVEIVIPILFEFFEGRFEVTIPEWATQGTKPGLD